jgi:hypothetical protein
MNFLTKTEISELTDASATRLLTQMVRKFRVNKSPVAPELWESLDSIVNQILYLEDHIVYLERYVVDNQTVPVYNKQ